MLYLSQLRFLAQRKACLSTKPNDSPSMTKPVLKQANWLFFAAFLFLTAGLNFGQTVPPPLLQDIQVKTASKPAVPPATPLVQKTGSLALAPVNLNPVRTLFPALADVTVPGYSGVL